MLLKILDNFLYIILDHSGLDVTLSYPCTAWHAGEQLFARQRAMRFKNDDNVRRVSKLRQLNYFALFVVLKSHSSDESLYNMFVFYVISF